MRFDTAGIAAVATAAVLALSGCSGSEPAPTPSTTVPVPRGFEVPEGVTLTKGGTEVKVGVKASVVYQVADRAASAITVTITEVAQGTMDDFRFFSLDDVTRRSTPYYVKATVKNEGPAGLGGAALPIFALDSTNTNLPANDIVGTFKPCPNPTLPESFLPGASADLCLVYLVPEGRTLTSINLQTGSTADAIRWGS